MNTTNVSSLIGTDDNILFFDNYDAHIDIVPCYKKVTDTGKKVEEIPVAGVIPILLTVGNKRYPATYTTFISTPIGDISQEEVLLEAPYAINFRDSVYYQIDESGELIYCICKSKVSDTQYKVKFRRNILNSNIDNNGSQSSIKVYDLGSIHTPHTSSDLGLITPTKFALKVKGDTESKFSWSFSIHVSLNINGVIATYDRSYGLGRPSINTVMKFLCDAFKSNPVLTDWNIEYIPDDENKEYTIEFTQKLEKVHKCNITMNYKWDYINEKLELKKIQEYNDTSPHPSGKLILIYREMARNLPQGQSKYPSYNYNTN